MSTSRRFKFRAVPRATRYVHSGSQHAGAVMSIPLAIKFQELVEQDGSSSSHKHFPVQHPVVVGNVSAAPMAQRLQYLLGDSETSSGRASFAVDDELIDDVDVDYDREWLGNRRGSTSAGAETSRGAASLRNDEADDDASDDEGWTRCSVKDIPMAQRLHELLGSDTTRQKQNQSEQKHQGNRRVMSDLELKVVPKEDDIEACENGLMEALIEPPLITRAQPLPRIAEQFQEALMAAPCDIASLPSMQISRDHDHSYSSRLQRLLQVEKLQHAEITRGLPLHTTFESIQVQILKKALEGRLTTCTCQVIEAPSTWIVPSSASSSVDQVQAIFNAKVAAELELDIGSRVRINPPWRELTLLGSSTRVILCTYFCEAVY